MTSPETQYRIKQLEDNDRIYRFLDQNAISPTLGIDGKNPTILLKSLTFYRSTEKVTIKDLCEGIIRHTKSNGSILENSDLNPTFITCWSHKFNPENAGPFPDAQIVIESTVGQVKAALIEAISKQQTFSREDFSHGRVHYYDISNRDHIEYMSQEYCSTNHFRKRNDFQREAEYRFALRILKAENFGLAKAHESITLDISRSYLNKIYLAKNHKISKEDIKKIKEKKMPLVEIN